MTGANQQVAAHESSSWSSELAGLMQAALQPVDVAGAIFFRVAFGALIAGWSWDYLVSGRVSRLYVAPIFHFTYPGFEWLSPLPGVGMYILFLVMIALALLIAIGWRYRVVSVLFAVCFTYFFLLERTNYQNHYYLLCLISWWMPWLPLNRTLSLDSRRRPELQSQTVARWVYWSLQFHIALPYVFGGVAKLTPDWMLGQPMGMFLQLKSGMPVIGSWLAWGPAGIAFSWLGLLFDLLVVPALLWKRTRTIAFVLCIAFHLSNSALFQIHVFPWFMIAATTIFFAPDWPRSLLGGKPLSVEGTAEKESIQSLVASVDWSWGRRLVVAIVTMYVAFHCLWPLRSRLYGEETSWTERAHLFSWRMMLRVKEVGIGYAVADPETGRIANVDHKQFLDAEQAEKFARDPQLVLQLAHFIADKFEREMKRRPQVHVFALASLNGRKAQLMIDPNVDLASQPVNVLGERAWVMPLKEPFRSIPWDVPMEQWREHVEMPALKFAQQSSGGPVSTQLNSQAPQATSLPKDVSSEGQSEDGLPSSDPTSS